VVFQNKKTEYFQVSLQTNHLSLPGKSVAVAVVLSTPGRPPDMLKNRDFSALYEKIGLEKPCKVCYYIPEDVCPKSNRGG
jgi:hypothetical protein